MKNEKYMQEYRYGFKLGVYEGTYNASIRFFKSIFGDDFKDKEQRIKWLSYYELELLFKSMLDVLCDKNKAGHVPSLHYSPCIQTIEKKSKILELLK